MTAKKPWPILTDDTIAAFWAYVDVRSNDECWRWLAGLKDHGYGLFRKRFAHRLALGMVSEHIPSEDIFALHSCDNPRCCNPHHLRWGTALDNARDRTARDRWRNPRAKITRQIVEKIRADGRVHSEIAAHYGLSKTHVSAIIARKRWP